MTHDDAAPRPFNGLALASSIMGSLSLLVAWIPVINLTIIIPAAIGLTCGVFGLRREGGAAMAIAGIVASGISLALVVLATVALAFLAKGLFGG